MPKHLKEVGTDASLHETAVQAVARGDVQHIRPRRSSAPQSRSGEVVRRSPVPDPLLEQAIAELMSVKGYPYTKVEIRSETEAVIR